MKAYIREHHKDLFDKWYKNIPKRFLDYISESAQWWVVLLFVILFFSLSSVINIDCLNFITLRDETSRLLVDQRTTNIATIISITLVVVGFLITNLAVKSPVTFKLLFKKSYLYPTIYLTLSTIACFIIVSTLRDTQIPYFDFSRAVLAGTYLAFAILFLIGFLFRTIIQFTNGKEITGMLNVELMNEAKGNMKKILLIKYSSEQYITTLQNHGAKEYDFSQALDFSTNFQVTEISEEEIIHKQVKDRVIQDIHINRIASLVSRKKKKAETVFYRKLSLEIMSGETNNFIWEKGKPNTKWNKFILGTSLILKRKQKQKKDTYVYRKYFDKQVEELSEESKYRNLETMLESYIELYTFQMQNQK
ncbi:MAG: hypothetical protein A3F72_16145 [Bacteroidetes bacterium RIFCSPLOWO2_12_FULL_35_15]|nr:MAG: hypothetical protein A3F72_16145 [Bacteroidetes bacterium RIFCSPLOWO2_12_FULL_35_15]